MLIKVKGVENLASWNVVELSGQQFLIWGGCLVDIAIATAGDSSGWEETGVTAFCPVKVLD